LSPSPNMPAERSSGSQTDPAACVADVEGAPGVLLSGDRVDAWIAPVFVTQWYVWL
jgi:hypothetical protein